MKLKHMLTGTLLMISLLLFNTITAFAAGPTGHLDGVTGDSISGWAWDNTQPDASLEVKVTVTKAGASSPSKEVTVTASDSRDDLASSGRGTGNYGFQAVVHWSELESGSYLIQATAGGRSLPNTLTYNTETAETSKGSAKSTSSAAVSGDLRSLGSFRTTAYCPCYSCSEGWGRRTSTGATAAANHTIAVDPRVIPYGSKVMINGVVYTAEDRGGGVKGKHIDIFFNSHSETRQYGSRNVEVFLLQ